MKRNSFLKSLATLLIAPSVVKDIEWEEKPKELELSGTSLVFGSLYNQKGDKLTAAEIEYEIAKIKMKMAKEGTLTNSGRCIDIEDVRKSGQTLDFYLQRQIPIQYNQQA